MANFLYYLPGQHTPPTLDELRRLGLAHAFSEAPQAAIVHRGPDGGSGVVVSRGCTGHRVGIYDGQRWINEPSASWWIGYYLDAVPTPDDLARADQISGELVRLGDHDWLIPHAREFIEFGGSPLARCNLPQTLSRDESGAWVPMDVKPQYAELWKLASDFVEAVYGADDEGNQVAFEFADADRLAMLAIETNYHAGPAEVDALRIYDSETRAAILAAINDVKGFAKLMDELVKKKADGSDQPADAGGTS